MRKCLLLLFVLSLGLAASSGFAANMLLNPGFEDDITSWETNVWAAGAGVASTADFHTGLKCCSFPSGGASAWVGLRQLLVPANPAKYYRISAWIKVPAAIGTWTFRGSRGSGGENLYSAPITSADWTLFQTGYLTVPAGRTNWAYVAGFLLEATATPAYYTDDWAVDEFDGMTLNGRVVDGAGNGVDGANVIASGDLYAAPATTTAGGGYYSMTVPPATYTVGANAPYFKGSTTVTVSVSPTTAANIVLAFDPDYDPDLIFSVYSSSLPPTGAWPAACPGGASLARMGMASTEIIGGVQWEKNVYTTGDGFRLGRYGAPISCSGASIVLMAKPIRGAGGDPWDSIVDIFYDRFCIGIRNVSGQVCVKRNINTNNTTNNSSAVIPEGQATVLSLVAQADGSYKVWANSSQIMDMAGTGAAFTSLDPTHTGWGDPDYTHYINVGRNNPDGWTTFNGNIGDVFVYKTAISESKRVALEWSLYDKFGIGGTTITITGKVTDSTNPGVGVAGAQVVVQVLGVDVPTIAALTNAGGNYTAQARVNVGDSFTVHASKANFVAGDSTPPILFSGSPISFFDVYVEITPLTTINVSGTVTDFVTGLGVVGVKVILTSLDLPGVSWTATTGAGGIYSADLQVNLTTCIADIDPTNSPMPVLLTTLANRTKLFPYDEQGYPLPLTGLDLSIYYPSTLTGKVVTSDLSSPAGFVVVATDPLGTATSATTPVAGTYSISVMSGRSYTVTAKKSGYVTTPGPQIVNVPLANTNYPVGDFTAIPTTISGVLKDAATGLGIYNGVVQSGKGVGSSAVVTDSTGAFTLPAMGCGGVELFGDALGYHCKNLFVTGSGIVPKAILLNAQAETGVIVNGGFENVVGGQPTDWGEKWVAGGLTFSASTDAFSGTYSVWYTGTASYSALAQYVPLTAGSVYNCYFKAKADPEVIQWFPMFSFRGDYTDPVTHVVDPDLEIKGWISGETGYAGWVHNPPYAWMQYLIFGTYSGDAAQPFVRIAPPAATATTTMDNIAATFCYATLPPVDKGCYVDDVVIDRSDANEPLVTVAPDPSEPPAVDVANLAALRAKPVGTVVQLTGNVTVIHAPRNAGARTTTHFYVGEAQGLGGLRVVDKVSDNLNLGDTVTGLTGTVKKTAAEEVYLELSADPTGVAGTAIKPIGVNNKSIMTDPKILTNSVRAWGKVHVTETDPEGNATAFTIDDGYNAPIPVNTCGIDVGKTADIEGSIASLCGCVHIKLSGFGIEIEISVSW